MFADCCYFVMRGRIPLLRCISAPGNLRKIFKGYRSNIAEGVPLKISDLYSMDVYSDAGQYLGEVRDAIVDLEKGEVVRILMEEWRTSDREEVKRMLQQKSVLFKNVKNVGDVVLVSAAGLNQRVPESAASQEVAELSRRQ